MHILINTALLVSILTLFSCQSSGPLTPEDAFSMAQKAMKRSDYTAMAGLLSRGSLEKINQAAALFKAMPGERLEVIAGSYGVTAEMLRNLTPDDYMFLMLGSVKEKSVLERALGGTILAVEKEGNRATIKIHNGLSLNFVKEGPYWKLDIVLL